MTSVLIYKIINVFFHKKNNQICEHRSVSCGRVRIIDRHMRASGSTRSFIFDDIRERIY